MAFVNKFREIKKDLKSLDNKLRRLQNAADVDDFNLERILTLRESIQCALEHDRRNFGNVTKSKFNL